MTIVSTLPLMAGIYQLSREGGPKSPRFTEYVKHAEHTLGLAGYNPMAGAVALDAVNALIAMNAEELAGDALADVKRRCAFEEEVALAIIVASTGMWTDRLATEVQHRTNPRRNALSGGIQLWTREPIDAMDVRREAAAEAIRVVWTAFHGAADTSGKVLSREGFAYASALNVAAAPLATTNGDVDGVIGVLGDSAVMGDTVALLYGDDHACQLGYTPLGLPDRAGFAWAAACATSQIDQLGVPQAIRTVGNFILR